MGISPKQLETLGFVIIWGWRQFWQTDCFQAPPTLKKKAKAWESCDASSPPEENKTPTPTSTYTPEV